MKKPSFLGSMLVFGGVISRLPGFYHLPHGCLDVAGRL